MGARRSQIFNCSCFRCSTLGGGQKTKGNSVKTLRDSEKDNIKAPIVQGGADDVPKPVEGELYWSGSLRSTSFEETARLSDRNSLDVEGKDNEETARLSDRNSPDVEVNAVLIRNRKMRCLPGFQVSQDWINDRGILCTLNVSKTNKSEGNETALKPARYRGIADDDIIQSTEAGLLYLHMRKGDFLSKPRDVKGDRLILSTKVGMLYLYMHECCPNVELHSGTTGFAIPCKNDIVVVADGLAHKTLDKKPYDARMLKIDEIGTPTYMLVVVSGDNVLYEPLLDSMIEEMSGARWTGMQCGEYAKTFLNDEKFAPPPKFNVSKEMLSKFSCRLIFATWESIDGKDPIPVIVRASKDSVENMKGFCCIGSGEENVARMLGTKDFSNSEKEEVARFAEDVMIDTSKKDPNTGGDVNIAHIDSSFKVTFEPPKSVTLLGYERAFRAGIGTSSSPKKRKFETKNAPKRDRKKL